MLYEIFKTLCLVTVVMLLILGTFLLLFQKQKRLTNKILAAFLLSNAVFILHNILFRNTGLLAKYHLEFFRIGIPFRFLFGPLLFLYTKSLTYRDFKLKKKHLIHLLPFLLEYLLLFLTFHIHEHDIKLEILRSPGSLFRQFQLPIFFLFNIQVLTYMFVCLSIINKFRKKSTNFHSNLDHVKLNWLGIILWGYIFMWLIDLVTIVIWLISDSKAHYHLFGLVSICIYFISIIMLFYYGLNYPSLLSFLEDNSAKKKYEKSALTEELKEIYLNKIKRFMTEEKPYLLYSLTLQDLSSQISISPNYLSQIINEMLNLNFFDFINAYRIEDAKKILRNDQSDKKSIIEIATELGFNSKSTFYKAFRKHTGTTPFEFRKSQQVRR